MRLPSLVLVACVFVAAAAEAQTSGPRDEVVQFFSEAVRCNAKLFTPAGHSASSNAAAVVLAPGEGETRASVESLAAMLARRGLVALAIDYRGWGNCGGLLYFAGPVRWDDRLRFMQMTTDVRIRRLRIDPKAQVIDIRNAITLLQGVPGVDRARVGVWGTGLSGGHAIVTAGSDARVRAVVAQSPLLAGRNEPRAAFAPSASQQAAMIKLARSGAAPDSERAARAMNREEAALARAEYKPFWYLEQIPPSTAVLFIADDASVAESEAASKVLKGANSVAKRAANEPVAADAAAQWFVDHLK